MLERKKGLKLWPKLSPYTPKEKEQIKIKQEEKTNIERSTNKIETNFKN